MSRAKILANNKLGAPNNSAPLPLFPSQAHLNRVAYRTIPLSTPPRNQTSTATSMSSSPEYARASPCVVLHPIAAGVLEVGDEEGQRFTLRGEDYAECKTPTMKEFRLPEVAASCPPAPRKRARTVRCKRRLSELELLVVGQEEMESVFMRRGVEVVSLKKKKKKRDTN